MNAASLFFALLAAVTSALAQAPDGPPEARLVAFLTEPRVPEFGEVFDLRITIRIAPEVVAFVPDTLIPSDASFSAGFGVWSETRGPADSVDVSGTYPVMSLLAAGVFLPSMELWTRRPDAGEGAGVRRASEAGPGLRRVLIPSGAIQIVPLSEMSETAARGDLVPRPPADVVGGQWSIWLLSAVGMAGIAVAILAWLLVSRWREARGAPVGLDETARALALRELDRLRGLGWHTDGRIVEFYDASTGVLRRFSGREGPEWGIALTSTELLARLQGRWGSESVEDLDSAVWVAEQVKFGSHRPGTEAAEGHWTIIRDWIEGMAED